MTTTRITATLDAHAAEIDLMSMPQRLEYLRAARQAAAPFGAGEQWRILEGVVQFFDAQGLGTPGTWVSWVNAGVLEGIGRGIVLALDPYADDHGNPGTPVWASYVRRHSLGELVVPSAQAHAWSAAKQVGTDYGVDLAARHGREPSPVEARFLAIARLYNWAMANRAVVDGLVAFAGFVDANLTGIDPAAVGRVFAVDDPTAAERALEIALTAASLEPQLPSLLRPVLALLPRMFQELSVKTEYPR